MYRLSPLEILTLVTLRNLEVSSLEVTITYISSMGLSVGDESFGHYSELGCFSDGLLIEVLLYLFISLAQVVIKIMVVALNGSMLESSIPVQ